MSVLNLNYRVIINEILIQRVTWACPNIHISQLYRMLIINSRELIIGYHHLFKINFVRNFLSLNYSNFYVLLFLIDLNRRASDSGAHLFLFQQQHGVTGSNTINPAHIQSPLSNVTTIDFRFFFRKPIVVFFLFSNHLEEVSLVVHRSPLQSYPSYHMKPNKTMMTTMPKYLQGNKATFFLLLFLVEQMKSTILFSGISIEANVIPFANKVSFSAAKHVVAYEKLQKIVVLYRVDPVTQVQTR